ncbi:aspartic-type endopeptidase-like protein [Emericellopsis cladophorae]|uniref:Aspartic-type endopeptidase-like protein n=1 Tax=Emericellopsis cladophorae TaxID=2686198 RepID=A0A9P9Y1S3_9HYPO|nr:aspartic-type endopeptidase-like protein [Emericellopsis cladophorae]KAI6781515.1 aspartic-type endopeptidase-like protein [Emericellopsis cladophorae]
MRSLQLLSAVLCASFVQAFYPYQPPWLEELREKRALSSRAEDVDSATGKDSSTSTSSVTARAAREALRLAKKYSGGDPDLIRRQNNYSIMEAEETGGVSTAGIDQDGTDYSYFVKVALGSKGKELYMLLDTGAGSSWVMGSACSSDACKLHNTFGPNDSDTFETEDKTFSVAYGSGNVKGSLAVDTLTVGGMSISFEFGIAKETSDDFVHFAFDGILGMSMNNGSSQNFMEELKANGEIDSSVFAVSLHRAADGDMNDGEVKFGSADKTKYQGDISYTDTASANNDWAIKLDDTAYDGKSSGAGDVLAYIDTGTTYIFGPKQLVKSFHSVIPGAKSSDGMAYKVPCDSDKTLTFTFSGVDYEVSPKDWISPKNDKGECTSNIYGQEVVKGAWLLGAAFIKNVYTVFDKEQRRIGFAAHVDEASEDEQSSSTSVAPSTMTTVVSTSDTVSMTMTATITSKPSLGLGGQEQTMRVETSSDTEESSAPTTSASSQESGDKGDHGDNEDDGPGNGSPTNIASVKLATFLCIASAFALLV